MALDEDNYVWTTQRWLNYNYLDVPGWGVGPNLDQHIAEDGASGWETIYALIKALQHELGITALADNFGDGTMAALTAYGDITPESTGNIVNILIGALYCKGYDLGDGGKFPGVWTDSTSEAVTQMLSDMGIGGAVRVTPKVFKSLLSMDAYVLLVGGRDLIRSVERWMNMMYIDQPWFSIIPADGLFSRNVQQMLIYAIQTELDVPGANGNFGPGTQGAMKARGAIQLGDRDEMGESWVRLFQAAMRCNGYNTDFTGIYSSGDRELVRQFQLFSHLPSTGEGDFQTWCSLLVSTGDPTRRGQAVDCASRITPARAQTLVRDGRLFVGRYLTNAPYKYGYSQPLDKDIRPDELRTIFDAGLRVFPIFETWGIEADYFTAAQGLIDGRQAAMAASALGFKVGTIIYFAVDFDAYGMDIVGSGDEGIVPYFRAVGDVLEGIYARQYRIGVYATRNVCSQLAARELTDASFLADMSTGFSGNLGFPMPLDWVFDQISTVTLGTGDGAIEIDNDIWSGTDMAEGSVDQVPLWDGEPELNGVSMPGNLSTQSFGSGTSLYFTKDCYPIIDFITGQTGPKAASEAPGLGRPDDPEFIPDATTIFQGKGYAHGSSGWWPTDCLAAYCNDQPLVIQSHPTSSDLTGAKTEVCFWVEGVTFGDQFAGPGWAPVMGHYLMWGGAIVTF